MGKLKFDIPHKLTKDEAMARVKRLIADWGEKYKVQATWEGDLARLSGRVMGINIEADVRISDQEVSGEATDPGMLLRGRARSYLEEKFTAYLDPNASPDGPRHV
jgi:hypothetical protein